jgi:hypothetical protein
MTEQIVEGVVSAEVDTEGREIVPNTATVPSRPVNVIWQASGQVRLIEERPKALAERVREAYQGGLEPKEKELLDRAAEQLGRRLSGEE